MLGPAGASAPGVVVKVVAVSPHLDDAAFSVGGVLARLADAGHDVAVVTCLTATVPDPQGFALACQTDKGLGPEVDYMAVRRAEDVAAMARLGVRHVHLPLPEAPHRGYDSPAALFAGIRPDDDLDLSVLSGLDADVLLAPQGLGGHVDHLQVVRAVAALGRPTAWWRDAPYVLRAPDAPPSPDLPAGLRPLRLPGDADRRADACACYVTQLPFQFGRDSDLAPEPAMRAAMARLDELLLADDAARALLT
ncbi:MAG: LmbE family protein [Frankiales bacterium]|nr:LmbE family protein [Frankiales bacterium]